MVRHQGIKRSENTPWMPAKPTWQDALASCGKSIPRGLRREIREWLSKTDDHVLLKLGVANLARLIHDVHPKPPSESRALLFKYILVRADEEKAHARAEEP